MAEQTPRRSSRSKPSAAKSTTKKPVTKKATSRETVATKTGTRKSTNAQRSAPKAEAPRRMSGSQVAEAAVRQLMSSPPMRLEGVTGLERSEDGWTVHLDVLELRRVPNTTDVLATYEIGLDSRGELESYRRVHRYVRGTVGEDGA